MSQDDLKDVARRANEIYDGRLRAQLEATHRDWYVAIEPDSGDYFLSRNMGESAWAAYQAHPGKPSQTVRVGHAVVVEIGCAVRMNGHVDDYGRALVRLTVRHPVGAPTLEVDAWIDTGFTGQLLLLPEQAAALTLPPLMAVPGRVADGSAVSFSACLCQVDWFGKSAPVEALVGAGRFALIGIGLLEDLALHVNYPAGTVTLVSPSAPNL